MENYKLMRKIIRLIFKLNMDDVWFNMEFFCGFLVYIFEVIYGKFIFYEVSCVFKIVKIFFKIFYKYVNMFLVF